jgi:hypothetical protein
LAEKELAEEEELEARQSKKMRQAMRKRGHLVRIVAWVG